MMARKIVKKKNGYKDKYSINSISKTVLTK